MRGDMTEYPSLLEERDITFRAERLDGGWSVTVGDPWVGFLSRRDFPTWLHAERWIVNTIERLYT